MHLTRLRSHGARRSGVAYWEEHYYGDLWLRSPIFNLFQALWRGSVSMAHQVRGARRAADGQANAIRASVLCKNFTLTVFSNAAAPDARWAPQKWEREGRKTLLWYFCLLLFSRKRPFVMSQRGFKGLLQITRLDHKVQARASYFFFFFQK